VRDAPGVDRSRALSGRISRTGARPRPPAWAKIDSPLRARGDSRVDASDQPHTAQPASLAPIPVVQPNAPHRRTLKPMKPRKWLWIAAAALCAFAVLIGYRAHPVDELVGIMRLQPVIYNYKQEPGDDQRVTGYTFTAPPSSVLAAIPGQKTGLPTDPGVAQSFDVVLPSGSRAYLYVATFPDEHKTCVLTVFSRLPWYERAWSWIKSRLGL